MPFILTYSEIRNELSKIIGSLEDGFMDSLKACRLMADELAGLSADVTLTHQECPDVPHLDTLVPAIEGCVDRLLDGRETLKTRREDEAGFLHKLREDLEGLIAKSPEYDEYVQDMRGSLEPVEGKLKPPAPPSESEAA